jgi:hypothetical protein
LKARRKVELLEHVSSIHEFIYLDPR